MSVDELPGAGRPPSTAALELPLWRLNLMRVAYAFMAIGLVIVKWPLVINYDPNTPHFQGVVHVLLTAMSILALIGLRYPVRLLPLLVFEVLWKLIWLGVVALPAAMAGTVDGEMGELIFNCSFVVIVLAATPWDYVWKRYVTAKGDRWIRATA